MSKENKQTQRGYFYEGAYPTASQFKDVVDGSLGVLEDVGDLPLPSAENLNNEYKIGNVYYKCVFNGSAYEWQQTGNVVKSNDYTDLVKKPKIGGTTLLPYNENNPQNISDFGGVESDITKYTEKAKAGTGDMVLVWTPDGIRKMTVESLSAILPAIIGKAGRVLAVTRQGDGMEWVPDEVRQSTASSASGLSVVEFGKFLDFNETELCFNGRFFGSYGTGTAVGKDWVIPENSPEELSACVDSLDAVLIVHNPLCVNYSEGLAESEEYCIRQELHIPYYNERFYRHLRYYGDTVEALTDDYTGKNGWVRCVDDNHARAKQVSVNSGNAILELAMKTIFSVKHDADFDLVFYSMLDFGENYVLVENGNESESINVGMNLGESLEGVSIVAQRGIIEIPAQKLCLLSVIYNPELGVVVVTEHNSLEIISKR